MKRFKILFSISLSVIFCFASLSSIYAGQFGPVEGLISDTETGKVIEGAKVSITTKSEKGETEVYSGITDKDGKYKFNAPIVKVGMSMSFNVLNPLVGKTIDDKATLYSSSAITFNIPVKNYESLFFYTQVFPIKVEKEGYKTFVGDVITYDFNASQKMGMYGTRAGWAKADEIALAKEDAGMESRVIEKYLTISDSTIEPNSASTGEIITISAKYNLAPDMKKFGGKLLAVGEINEKVIKVELKDDGKKGDKQAGDSVFTGQLKIEKKWQAGDYKIYVFADERPRGKRAQDMMPLKGTQMAARNILEGTFSVK